MEITVFEVWHGWVLQEKRTGVGCLDIKLALAKPTGKQVIGKQANPQTDLLAALDM